MTDPHVAFELERIRLTQEWGCQPSPQARTDYFAREVAPYWVPVFREVSFRDAPEGFNDSCEVLISLVGVSWQPAMLMAARLRPTRLVLLTTDNSSKQQADGMGVRALTHRFTGIPVEDIIIESTQSPVELDVYRLVKRYRAIFPEARIFIDPTGGLKSMASAVALAGFLYGLTIVYIDSDERDVGTGMPVLGSEYPRVLHNPLEVLGDLEFRRIEEAFNAGRYTDAAIRAADLKIRLFDQNQAEIYRILAEFYGAWDRFYFQEALAYLGELTVHYHRIKIYRNQDPNVASLSRALNYAMSQRAFVLQLCRAEESATWEEGVCLVLNHLSAARRRLDHDDSSAALLLLYATVERCVTLLLKLDHGVDIDKVSWTAIPPPVQERFQANIKAFIGTKSKNRKLPTQLAFSSAIALIAAFERTNPVIDFPNDKGWLRGLAVMRNKCEFEHGFVPQPVERTEVEKKYSSVQRWLQRLLGEVSLEENMKACRFPRL